MLNILAGLTPKKLSIFAFQQAAEKVSPPGDQWKPIFRDDKDREKFIATFGEGEKTFVTFLYFYLWSFTEGWFGLRNPGLCYATPLGFGIPIYPVFLFIRVNPCSSVVENFSSKVWAPSCVISM